MENNHTPQIDLTLPDADNGNNTIKGTADVVDVTPVTPVVKVVDNDDVTTGEDNDVNDIAVSDKRSPIIMLFGPRSSGKSMTLVRLARYLRSKGYTISTDFTFRSDSDYDKKCKEFISNLDTKDALPGTAFTDFLLLKVSRNGRTICQLLEAPGEHYFDQENINADNFPPYMTEIIRSLPNRKIWVFIAETKWRVKHEIRTAYINRIKKCMNVLVNRDDRFLILYNKIDQRDDLYKNGRIITAAAGNSMREEYDGLADAFKNDNPITSLWRGYKYKFVPFCTGHYSKSGNRLTYTQSDDSYPRKLWESLLKCIKG